MIIIFSGRNKAAQFNQFLSIIPLGHIKILYLTAVGGGIDIGTSPSSGTPDKNLYVSDMEDKHISDIVISSCINNGRRLLEDAEYLHEDGRFPSANALAILAQEFAKAFILNLVKEGAIPLSSEVLRATRDHSCKHLMAIVMEYLFVEWEGLVEHMKTYFQQPYPPKIPDKIADALDMFCHEKIGRWKANNWVWAEDPAYDKEIKKVANGSIDKAKQNSIYVSITKTGELGNYPKCDSIDALKQIGYAKVLEDVANGHDIYRISEKEQIKISLKNVFESF